MLLIDGKIIEINRADVEISEVDEAYCQLAKEILEHGVLTENRTGIDTISIPNWNFVFHLDTKLLSKNLSVVLIPNYEECDIRFDTNLQRA